MKNTLILAAAALVAVPIGLSYLGVFNKAATTPSRVVNKTLDTNNVIQSYERFFQRKANFESRLPQIANHAAYLKEESDPTEARRLRMELVSMQQACRETANEYNADAEKLTTRFFQSKNLPARLNAKKCEIGEGVNTDA